MIQHPVNFLIALVFSATLAPMDASADGFALKDYLLEDVVAIAYADLEKFEKRAVVEIFRNLDAENQEFDEFASAMHHLDSEISQLKDAGIQTAFALIRTTDLNQRGTSLVFPVEEGHDVGAAADAIRERFKKAQLHKVFRNIQVGNGAVLAAANDDQMKRLSEKRPLKLRNLDEAWNALGQGAFGLLIFGDDDSRRVVRELLPALPAPFDSLTGEMVAEKLAWGGIELSLNPLKIKMEIEANDAATASKVGEALHDGTAKLFEQFPKIKAMVPEKVVTMLVESMKPMVEKTRVKVSLDSITGDIDRLTDVLAKPVSEVRQAARMQAEMNKMRQLVLGVHNHEAAFNKFPNPFGVTEQTPKGLSWRVQILPFIEQGKLYEQFRLEEPWNSEHNLQLVKQMPQIYKSPLVKGNRINTEGKTIFQVPVGEGTAFDKKMFEEKGSMFASFKDGTSNTIIMVAVTPEQAVIWTKPDDWEVDLDDPWKGLRAEGREKVTVVHADGSVHSYPLDIKPEILRAMITKAGMEVVPFPFK